MDMDMDMNMDMDMDMNMDMDERHEGFAIIHAIKWVAKLGQI
jgi:hypothetical protein